MKNSGGIKSFKRQGGWIQLAIAAAGVASSIMGGKKQAKAAKKAGKAEAAAIMETGAEQKRRTIIGQKQSMGEAEALSAASGIQDTGSTKLVKDAMATEYAKELAWMDKATTSAANAAKRGAKQAADTYMTQGLGSALGYVGSYVGSSGIFDQSLTTKAAGGIKSAGTSPFDSSGMNQGLWNKTLGQ